MSTAASLIIRAVLLLKYPTLTHHYPERRTLVVAIVNPKRILITNKCILGLRTRWPTELFVALVVWFCGQNSKFIECHAIILAFSPSVVRICLVKLYVSLSSQSSENLICFFNLGRSALSELRQMPPPSSDISRGRWQQMTIDGLKDAENVRF